MGELRARVRKFAPKDAPVLIVGETGTGKELVARNLHAHGLNPAGPFVAINCAAVPATMADGYFFGHEKGAFTGADRARAGVLEEADGGTLFLDEVNSLSADLQGKLLRALQEGELRRLGSNRMIPVRFRLLSATNGDLEELVKRGSFREDLFYRLQVLRIDLPPLRDRREDLPELFAAFLPSRTANEDLWRILRRHTWPGNVREFRHLLLALDAMADPGRDLGSEDLPEHLLRALAAAPAPGEEEPDKEHFTHAQAEREREFLAKAYRSAQGNVSRLARTLDMDRSHLHQKLVKLGIHRTR
jgi:transcriptional regulator with PAS, ATPase and Fis domain